MIEIVKLKYEDRGPWYSSHKRIKEFLTNPNQEELFIVYYDDKGEMTCDLLTDLVGKKVFVKDEVIKIPY